MTNADKPSLRRTLPAPSAPLDVDGIRSERDHLLVERDHLIRRLALAEQAVSEGRALSEEVVRLRADLARAREELAGMAARVATRVAATPSPYPASAATPIRSGASTPGAYRLYEDGAPTGYAAESAPMDARGLDFGTVSRLSPEELDGLPYGLICLDAKGRVVHYNDTESRLARLPKERVIGRDFFAEVAPCARVREFEGEFRALAADPLGVRVRTFDFVFRFRHAEQHVTIVMTPARQRGLFNVALVRRSVQSRGE